MSVLYKALQKAAKENEQQAAAQSEIPDDEPTSPFDPERLAGSGAISSGSRLGGLKANWRVAGLASAVVLALVIVAVFFLVDTDDPAPVQVAQTPPAAPAQPQQDAAPSTAAPEARQSPMDLARETASPSSEGATSDVPASAGVEAQQSDDMMMAAGDAAAPATEDIAMADPVMADPADAAEPEMPVEQTVSPEPEAAAEPAVAAQPAAPAQPQAVPAQTQVATLPAAQETDPMPELGRDSPARVLSPPISIQRAEAAFNSAEDLVVVREVSLNAQENVTAGYNALVRGDLGGALERYEAALASEPTSVMAQLGRSAALQKLGRLEEARSGYETVLRIDPNNREALANLTSIYSVRAPNEAMTRLLELEREYPDFSPVKAQIGLLYARMGSTEDALRYLRSAASMAPDTVMYQYNLAVMLDRIGRSEQAVIAYERVLAGIINGSVASNLSR